MSTAFREFTNFFNGAMAAAIQPVVNSSRPAAEIPQVFVEEDVDQVLEEEDEVISHGSEVEEEVVIIEQTPQIPSKSNHVELQAELRRRIRDIHSSTETNDKEKAHLMQSLMMENFMSLSKRRPSAVAREIGEPLSAADLAKTYFDEETGILGCQHYRRSNKLQCSTCNAWATCRFCHDEEADHTLIRHETKNMLCMSCQTAQPAAQYCQNCSRRMAKYYCNKCKLWDDDPNKAIYHCNSCGICRVGHGLGKDFFHCDTCNVCMAMELQDSHKCIEHSTECNCPICGEYMFSSTKTVVFMPCGHSIHQNCYHNYMKTNYRCPSCSKSLRNMDSTFRTLDHQIAQQRMPPPYDTWKVNILCNDCNGRSTVKYHFLGAKCDGCLSYNTVECNIIKSPGSLVEAQQDTASLVERVDLPTFERSVSEE